MWRSVGSRTFLLAAFAAGLAMAAGAGCASAPRPARELAAADLAVRKAEQAGATQQASLPLYRARQKLEQAREAMENERNVKARRLAEEALVDAQLAEAQARSAETQRTAAQVREDIEVLRAETLGETEPETQ